MTAEGLGTESSLAGNALPISSFILLDLILAGRYQ